MSKPNLNYYVVPRKEPGKDSVKFYAQKVTYTNIGSDELLARILANTAVPRGVVRSAVDAIIDSVVNFVLNGHSVELGGLMSLRCTLRSPLQNIGSATKPDALDPSAYLRLRAYWGNDVRKFQSPSYYDFTRVVKTPNT